MKDIIHEYYKKDLEEGKIIIQIDPKGLKGTELLVSENGQVKKTRRTFDEEIFDDLVEDEFLESSPLEFNLYLKGLHNSE
ncbi:MAG: hypothetical protein AAF363_15240 [Bacteroidota bacterium]